MDCRDCSLTCVHVFLLHTISNHLVIASLSSVQNMVLQRYAHVDSWHDVIRLVPRKASEKITVVWTQVTLLRLLELRQKAPGTLVLSSVLHQDANRVDHTAGCRQANERDANTVSCVEKWSIGWKESVLHHTGLCVNPGCLDDFGIGEKGVGRRDGGLQLQ